MKIRSIIIILFVVTAFNASCQTLNIKVKNNLDFDRNEVVAIRAQQLSKLLKGKDEAAIRIKKQGSKLYQPLQWIDYNQDGIPDELLFMATVQGGKTSRYSILLDAAIPLPQSEITTYSRFVPERTDDYSWENDKVAFRTYGPDAQQRAEQKRENGTLSSGIDLWLKRTDKPVINTWYEGYKTNPNFYHMDRGEGYDPYHVGASRGTGGSGVWENDSLYVSKNFVGYKTIATGPLRTIFELTYATWSNYEIAETKRISLDVGTNFSKFEIDIKAGQHLPNYTIGISLHKNEGETYLNQQQGWFRHWEKIDDGFVGEGIVVDPALVSAAFAHTSPTPDQSNLLILTQPKNKKLTYYAGFAWSKSGQVSSVSDWEKLLQRQAEIIANPLVVTVE